MSSNKRVVELAALEREVVACRRCPRLVAHRYRAAKIKTRRFEDQDYWGKPVPAFGDPCARLLVVGLAPAAHGANRTGRMFTGDRSGDWLYEALYRYGFANLPQAVARDDGLRLSDAFITAAARCAPPGNKPTAEEFARCQGYLVGELQLLRGLRVVVALGRLAFDRFLAAWRALGRVVPSPKPRFAHGSSVLLAGEVLLLGSYHPSQQNTFTGKLTRPMFHRVFRKARQALQSMDRAHR
ncbi:MAG: uracil-DNA glycosylase [Acidobacteriota bacterium]